MSIDVDALVDVNQPLDAFGPKHYDHVTRLLLAIIPIHIACSYTTIIINYVWDAEQMAALLHALHSSRFGDCFCFCLFVQSPEVLLQRVRQRAADNLEWELQRAAQLWREMADPCTKQELGEKINVSNMGNASFFFVTW